MLADPLAYLFSAEQFGIKLGLDNISALLDELGHPERQFKAAHIAGTNGKGSVTAMVDRALRAAGYRSARYTSPHLVDLAERFVIEGRPVDARTLAAAVDDVRLAVDRCLARATLQVQPTFFELTTAVAFHLFSSARVEVAVCEVGLGGRLDATNVLNPVGTAITSIALDHEQHLGRTLRDIAREKAGIIKPSTPVVVGSMPLPALEEIDQTARARGAELIRAWEGTLVHSPAFPGTRRITLRTPARDYGEIELALAGSHQIGNAVVAVRLLETLDARGLGVPEGAVREGLSNVTWPGRLDRRLLPDGREALLDAAHNPEGSKALATYLRHNGGPPRPIVFAASRDKDLDGMLLALAGVAASFVFTRSSSSRSAEPSDLAARAHVLLPHVSVLVEPNPLEAMAAAWRRSPHIVIAGSIFLLGDVMKEFGWS